MQSQIQKGGNNISNQVAINDANFQQIRKLDGFQNELKSPRITVNLEDAVLEEQKLWQILEVIIFLSLSPYNCLICLGSVSEIVKTPRCSAMTGGT